MDEAKKHHRAADAAAQRKKSTYKELATPNNLGFIPLIFEITGSMHREVPGAGRLFRNG
jgi:hypothetical protein